MMNEPLSSIMSTDLITVRPGDTLKHVRELFLSSRIHHLPVVEKDKRLVGIVTSYDLFKLDAPPVEYGSIPVSSIMTTKLAKLAPDQKIGVAAEIFLENLFHAVPIVQDDKLIGIVTSFDVLKYEFQKAYPTQSLTESNR